MQVEMWLAAAHRRRGAHRAASGADCLAQATKFHFGLVGAHESVDMTNYTLCSPLPKPPKPELCLAEQEWLQQHSAELESKNSELCRLQEELLSSPKSERAALKAQIAAAEDMVAQLAGSRPNSPQRDRPKAVATRAAEGPSLAVVAAEPSLAELQEQQAKTAAAEAREAAGQKRLEKARQLLLLGREQLEKAMQDKRELKERVRELEANQQDRQLAEEKQQQQLVQEQQRSQQLAQKIEQLEQMVKVNQAQPGTDNSAQLAKAQAEADMAREQAKQATKRSAELEAELKQAQDKLELAMDAGKLAALEADLAQAKAAEPTLKGELASANAASTSPDQRQETVRLISALEDESIVGLTAPVGAGQWSCEQVREYFESDGEKLPAGWQGEGPTATPGPGPRTPPAATDMAKQAELEAKLAAAEQTAAELLAQNQAIAARYANAGLRPADLHKEILTKDRQILALVRKLLAAERAVLAWRAGMQQTKQTVLGTWCRVPERTAELRQLRLVLAYMFRGELGLGLQIWREQKGGNMRDEPSAEIQKICEENLERLFYLEADRDRAGRVQGLRLAGAVLSRLGIGSCAVAACHWQLNMLEAGMRCKTAVMLGTSGAVQALESRADNSAQLTKAQAEAGLARQQAKQATKRSAELEAELKQAQDKLELAMEAATSDGGDAGNRLGMWRRSVREQEAVEAKQKARLVARGSAVMQNELQGKLNRLGMTAGLQQLRLVLTYATRGELRLRRMGISACAVAACHWQLNMLDAGTRRNTTVVTESSGAVQQLAAHLGMWRRSMLEQEAVEAEEKARLQSKLKRLLMTAGLQQLRMVLAYLMKGELGLRLQIWRTDMQQAKQIMLSMQCRLTEQMAGLRQLRLSLAHMVTVWGRGVRGELDLRLQIWREQKGFVTQNELQSKLKRFGVTAGLQQLRLVLTYRSRGDLGLKLQIWRHQQRDATQATEQNELLCRLKQLGATSGLQQLRLVLAFAVKGELGLRLQIWRADMQEAREALLRTECLVSFEECRISEMQCKLTEQMAGLRQLRLSLAHMVTVWGRGVRGELDLRLQIWREQKGGNMRDEPSAEIQKIYEENMDHLFYLEGEHDHAARVQGLRLAGAVLSRMCFGACAVAACHWQLNMLEAGVARGSAAMQNELQSKLNRLGMTAGLQQLRLVLAYATRGELRLRLDMWVSKSVDPTKPYIDLAGTVAVSYQVQLKNLGNSSGLRQLRAMLGYMIRGEIGLRLQIWRGEAQLARDAALAMKYTLGERTAGLQHLRLVLARIIRDAMSGRIQAWCRAADAAMQDYATTSSSLRCGGILLLRINRLNEHRCLLRQVSRWHSSSKAACMRKQLGLLRADIKAKNSAIMDMAQTLAESAKTVKRDAGTEEQLGLEKFSSVRSLCLPLRVVDPAQPCSPAMYQLISGMHNLQFLLEEEEAPCSSLPLDI